MPKLVNSSQLTVHRILKTVNRELKTVNCRPWRYGFTLIELLVVLGILAAAVGATLIFLTSVLKGTNQANVTAEVKQNGQVVLYSLEKQIRNATDAQPSVSFSFASDHIILTRPNSPPLHIACFPPYPSVNPTINGWIGVGQDPGMSVSNYTTVTNQDTVAGVSITDCDLTVTLASAGSLSPPIVKISFVVSQGVSAPSRQDFVANAKFETTISLRNF